MLEVQPFRGYRYDLGRVGSLSSVTAPPYDVIDSALQNQLYEQSPDNVIRLILTKETGDARYQKAAQTLRDWLADDVLVQDSARSFYVYHQQFDVGGQTFVRRGFMGRVRLQKFGEGQVYAHEETMPGPKADRLALMHATGMNLSQIFSFYPDTSGEVQTTLDKAVGRALPLEATDHLGVVHRLWLVSDQHVLSTVSGMMGPKPVFIADGHHRYETALKYLEETNPPADDAPARYVMMMLVGMNDPGMIVLPTHRLLSGLAGVKADQIRGMLGDYFEIETIGTGPKATEETWQWMDADGGQEVLGIGTTADGVWQTARFRSPDLMTDLVPQRSPVWRSLGVSILHVAVLGHLIPKAKLGEPQCRYVHQVSEVNQAMAVKECDAAVLTPPASMEHVERVAGNMEKMPPKSTYFYPKLQSGLLFHSLKAN